MECAIARDAEDHISWLLQHGWHEKALAAVEAGQGRSELLDEVLLYHFYYFLYEGEFASLATLFFLLCVYFSPFACAQEYCTYLFLSEIEHLKNMKLIE